MSYNYGGYSGNARAYDGGFQEYDRYRGGGPRIGGDSTFGVQGGADYDRGYGVGGGYNVSRDFGYGGIGGAGRSSSSYRTGMQDYSSSSRNPAGYGQVSGGYGPSNYTSSSDARVGRDYEREQRIASKHMYRTSGVVGGGSSSRRQYRGDTNDRSAYRNKQRDASTSSSSSSDNEGEEGWAERMGNKIKGVFGYGPDAENNNNNNNNNDQYNNYSSRRGNERYNNNNIKSSSYNKYNNSGYGGSYGGGGNYGDNIVSLRGRQEIAPSHVSEESGSKQLVWQVNAQGFDLDNIKVADAGNNKIEITGHAEDVGQHHRRTKQFTRIITLPEGSNAKDVKSKISGRGLLTITVPYTGKGLQNYGTRELQVGQGSVHGTTATTGSRTTAATGNTTSTGSYGSGNKQQQQQQQHGENFQTGSGGAGGGYSSTTTSTTRSTNNA